MANKLEDDTEIHDMGSKTISIADLHEAQIMLSDEPHHMLGISGQSLELADEKTSECAAEMANKLNFDERKRKVCENEVFSDNENIKNADGGKSNPKIFSTDTSSLISVEKLNINSTTPLNVPESIHCDKINVYERVIDNTNIKQLECNENIEIKPSYILNKEKGDECEKISFVSNSSEYTPDSKLTEDGPHYDCDSIIKNEHELEEKANNVTNEMLIAELNSKNAFLEKEIFNIKRQMSAQELAFKKSELQTRTEFLSNMEKLSKDCNMLRKEKEAMVIKYANSEKEVINEKKILLELERKLKDLYKERDNFIIKVKNLTSENSRLSNSCESKLLEIAKLQKSLEKLNADFNARDIRIKWLQNKLKIEIESHQETQLKYDSTLHRLNNMKEEAEQVRKDCQEMIKCYQEAEEIKSVKLDSQLKQKVSELEVQKQEKSDQDQVYHLLKQELDAIKKKQRMTMEESNSLTLKINNLEKERLEYEQNLSKQKDSQNILKQEVVDLTARLAEMETLHLQLNREKDKSAASLREVERLRSTNAELQADMNACHKKEGELLKFTEGVTDTNVKLQSAHSLLEVKAQALEEDLMETKGKLSDNQQKCLQLAAEIERIKIDHDDEVQLLVRKLAEKTKNVEKLNTKLDESENENRVLKRRHIASIKELSRELYECKKKIDVFDSCSIRGESVSLGSRSSSTASLDVSNATDNRANISAVEKTSKIVNGEQICNKQVPPSEFPEIDKEMLIERIIKLQKTLARKNDKIDFLEDHIVQLVKEMRKKSKHIDLKTV